jgi:hypothetical protein
MGIIAYLYPFIKEIKKMVRWGIAQNVDDLRRCTQVDSHIKIKNVESFVVN